jgi:hypothetical protein
MPGSGVNIIFYLAPHTVRLMGICRYMIKLNETALDAIKASTKIKGRLQATLDISSNTLYKYIKTNDMLLTTASALAVLREETGRKDSDLLTSK